MHQLQFGFTNFTVTSVLLNYSILLLFSHFKVAKGTFSTSDLKQITQTFSTFLPVILIIVISVFFCCSCAQQPTCNHSETPAVRRLSLSCYQSGRFTLVYGPNESLHWEKCVHHSVAQLHTAAVTNSAWLWIGLVCERTKTWLEWWYQRSEMSVLEP